MMLGFDDHVLYFIATVLLKTAVAFHLISNDAQTIILCAYIAVG